MKHTNSILEQFEYFCQMTSKSILIIKSYTVSKLVHFFLRHSVVFIQHLCHCDIISIKLYILFTI